MRIVLPRATGRGGTVAEGVLYMVGASPNSHTMASSTGRAVSWLVWGGVSVAYVLWLATAALSMAELMNVYTRLSYIGWVMLTAASALWSVVFAITSVLLPRLGGAKDSCCGALESDVLHRKRASLWLHWCVHAFSTSLVTAFVAQFYTHYTDQELEWLTEARRSPSQRSDQLDVLVLFHWRELHLLVVMVCVLLASLFLVLRIDSVIFAGPEATTQRLRPGVQ